MHKQDEEKHNIISVGHHYAQTSTNKVNKRCALIQTSGDKDEPEIVFMRTSQHRTQNVKTQENKRSCIYRLHLNRPVLGYNI